MADEFGCGEQLERKDLGEEDIENLIIQQIEFCNIILLNKASEVKPEALAKIKKIIREIQTKAQIIECDYANVDIEKLLDTNAFDFRQTEAGAGWIRGIESDVHEEEHHHEHHHERDEDEHHHDHEHDHEHDHDEDHAHDHEHEHDQDQDHESHHHHHHDHEGGEVEEYGIGTFVYYRRQAFDLNKFDWFVSGCRRASSGLKDSATSQTIPTCHVFSSRPESRLCCVRPDNGMPQRRKRNLSA